MFDTSDLTCAATGNEDIIVSAYRQQLDSDDCRHRLWGYCLRIENNSAQRIRLLRKDLCVTDNNGKNFHDMSYGFHGELPDLEPGECFEFEDTALIDAAEAVLYGSCLACTADGREFKINLPLIPLLSAKSNADFYSLLN